MTDHEQEARWATERDECLERWIEGRARAIAARPSVFERRMALEQLDYGKPAQIRVAKARLSFTALQERIVPDGRPPRC